LIRVKGDSPFYRRLHTLFFDPRETKASWKSASNHARLHLRRVPDIPTSIYEIDNFVSEAELAYFNDVIQACTFQKSFVDNMHFNDANTDQHTSPNKRQRRTILDDSHRTSTFYGFKHRADATIRAIEQRTADLLGCWIHQIEGLQLVRYLPGQFFGVHHDLGDLMEDDRVLLPRKHLALKRRLVTIFVYLNDLEPGQGGCTYFPKCGNLRVRPSRGKAILWSNVLLDGNPDPNTIHAGEAVLGEKNVVKYGLNIWITED
jgi:2OG-Fe(II) oxygenase superfamily